MPVHLTGLQFYIQTFVMGLNRNLSFLVTGTNMEVKKKSVWGASAFKSSFGLNFSIISKVCLILNIVKS